jgi:NitT/TauT family transport system substrate-binding protein
MPIVQSRRRFLTTVSLAGAAGLIGSPQPHSAEPPPETSTVRIATSAAICLAPQYVAEELLRAEGFTDVHYPRASAEGNRRRNKDGTLSYQFPRGEVDFLLDFGASLVMYAEAGDPVTVLAGVHPACFELFGNERIHSILDLKGKSVGVETLDSAPYVFLSVMAGYVGLDPLRDIHWVTSPSVPPVELFVSGKVDAFLGFPPEPQELRARNVGHVIVNSTVDRPWSQYYCCMVAGDRDYVRNYPVATKHVLRAILKATDICAAQPEWAARRLVDGGFAKRYDYALQTLKDVPYDRWREYDPEDTIRFYALRLRELGMIKSDPDKVITVGTKWRFLNDLKHELKG